MKILRSFISTVFITLLVMSIAVSTVQAAAYGSGSYSVGNYNTGDTSGGSSNGSSTSGGSSGNSLPSAPTCNDQAPGAKAPWLYAALPQDGNSILLFFTDADDPVDKYALTYGLSSGNYQYGQDNIGGKGMRTYLVQSLEPHTTYYFKVRGGHGCATGSWSNEISATTKTLVTGNNLAFISSELNPVSTPQPTTTNVCQTYIVKKGDTFRSIAASQLGDSTKYQEIIDQNEATYPAIANLSLKVGWSLQLNCHSETQPTPTTNGYEVKIKVSNTQKQPVVGAQVTLHSTPRTAITDKNGIADFQNVESGQHQVLIAYANFKGEQTVNLTGDVKEFDLNVQVKEENVLFSKQVFIIIGILLVIIVALVMLLIRERRKRNPEINKAQLKKPKKFSLLRE